MSQLTPKEDKLKWTSKKPSRTITTGVEFIATEVSFRLDELDAKIATWWLSHLLSLALPLC
jgi:hypothetical protein